jgi:hypothetical protein
MDIPKNIKHIKILQEEQAIDVDGVLKIKFKKAEHFELIWFVAKEMADSGSLKCNGVAEKEIHKNINAMPDRLTQYWSGNICLQKAKLSNVYIIIDLENNKDVSDEFENDKECFPDFLKEKLFKRQIAQPELKLNKSSKVFSVAAGIETELVPGPNPYRWEPAKEKNNSTKGKSSQSTKGSREMPSRQTFENIMRSLRILQHFDLEAESETIFDSIYETISRLKDPNNSFEIAKIVLMWGGRHNHPEIFGNWDSPINGMKLFDWVEDYEGQITKNIAEADFPNSLMGDFVLDMVNQQLEIYDALVEVIKNKAPKQVVKKMWRKIKPKGFFMDDFLKDITLMLDKRMVQDYANAICKLKEIT